MTDIESKLSAIKAINEEKEYCEACVVEILQLPNPKKIVIPKQNHNYMKESDTFWVTQEIGAAISSLLQNYYLGRHAELIAKAGSIMKSEDSPPETGNQ